MIRISPVIIGLLFGAMVNLVPGSAIGSDPELPPANIFDMSAMLDVSTLDLKILSDEILSIGSRSGNEVREVKFEFFSHSWQGEPLRHKATVYVPADGISPEKIEMAVANQSGSSNVESGFDIFLEYGAYTALDLGIPAMLIEFSIAHSGIQRPGPLRRFTTHQFFETGDPNWIHWVALAKSYMRAMTAVNQVEGIEATRFVLGGSSKRAQAAWIVAAADERVEGLVAIARPGNLTHFVQNRMLGRLVTPEDYPIPGGKYRERMAYIEDLYTRRGYEYMAYIDPYYFLSRVNVPVMCLVGTNDELMSNWDDHGFYPFYQGQKRFGYVPNYPHGMASGKHSEAYRAWAGYCFFGNPAPRLTAMGVVENGSLHVQSIVHAGSEQGKIQKATLYYSVLEGQTFSDRKDRFLSLPMKREGETSLWSVALPLEGGVGREVFWYVEASSNHGGLDGFSCTLLERTVLQ